MGIFVAIFAWIVLILVGMTAVGVGVWVWWILKALIYGGQRFLNARAETIRALRKALFFSAPRDESRLPKQISSEPQWRLTLGQTVFLPSKFPPL